LARNIEIKAAVADPGAVRRLAASIASAPSQLIDQTDTFFIVPRGRLKVRQFADGTGELIAYDRADDAGPKTSNYSIVACSDASQLVEILSKCVPIRGRVVKRRELFLVDRTRVHLDEVEGLGCFVELEVVLKETEPIDAGTREAYDLMDRLGISRDWLVPDAYIDLIERRVTIRSL
jgi:predicted adenylyl cyclase CyaB